MNNQLIKLNDIVELTKRSKAMVYKDISAGLFPSPLHLGGENTRGSYFLSDEVNAVILARGACYSDKQIKLLVSNLKDQREERFQDLLTSIGF